MKFNAERDVASNRVSSQGLSSVSVSTSASLVVEPGVGDGEGTMLPSLSILTFTTLLALEASNLGALGESWACFSAAISRSVRTGLGWLSEGGGVRDIIGGFNGGFGC